MHHTEKEYVKIGGRLIGRRKDFIWRGSGMNERKRGVRCKINATSMNLKNKNPYFLNV